MQAVVSRDGYVLVAVRVQPKASRTSIAVEPDGRIRVALTAPPVEGAANKALCDYFAKELHVPRKSVEVVKGEKSREKTLRVEGINAQQVEEFLNSHRKVG